MKLFYALALMMVLAFGLAPSAMAHSMAMQGDCPKAMAQADTADVAKADLAQADAPCKTDCPSQHQESKGGCCMSAASCHSIGVMSSPAVSHGLTAQEAKITTFTSSIYASALIAGPQKPPKLS